MRGCKGGAVKTVLGLAFFARTLSSLRRAGRLELCLDNKRISYRIRLDYLKLKNQEIWIVWGLLILTTALLHSFTIRISPVIWQDEAQIIDFGRTLMSDADLTYGITWLTEYGRPAQYLAYLGNLAQNLAFVYADGDLAGPRLFSLLGAGFAASALLGWLLVAGSPAYIAVACASLFLWDPLLTHGYRGARVDVWAMGFMFLAFISLRKQHGEKKLNNFLAGFFVAVSGVTWISAILLIPLLAHEIYQTSKQNRNGHQKVSWGCVATTTQVSFGALVTVVLLLLPFFRIWEEMVLDLHSIAGGRILSGESKILGLLEPFRQTPWLFLGGVLAMVFPCNRGLSAAFVAAVIGVLLTGPYMHRDTYLIPYLLRSLQTLFSGTKKWAPAAYFISAYLALSMVWASGVSIGFRTIKAMRERGANNPQIAEALLQKATAKIQLHGAHSPRVFIGEWQLYYAARKSAVEYLRLEIDWDRCRDRQLIGDLDALILPVEFLDISGLKALASLGFKRTQIITPTYAMEPSQQPYLIPTRRRYHDIEVWEKKEKID